MKALPTVIQEKKGELQPFCISSHTCSLLPVGWGAPGFKEHRDISPKVSTALGA